MKQADAEAARQARDKGEARWTFLREKVAPALVTFAIVTVGGALLTQYFQYNQWRQTTALQRAQELRKNADATAQGVFDLIAKRHYYTLMTIDTWAEDADARHADWTKKYRDMIERWNLDYHALVARIGGHLDEPSETDVSTSESEMRGVNCQRPLIDQLARREDARREVTFADGGRAVIYSSGFMLAAINYCFRNISNTFFRLRTETARDLVAPADRLAKVAPLRADLAHLLSNQNLLRRNILTQVSYIGENDAVPSPAVYFGLRKPQRRDAPGAPSLVEENQS